MEGSALFRFFGWLTELVEVQIMTGEFCIVVYYCLSAEFDAQSAAQFIFVTGMVALSKTIRCHSSERRGVTSGL